MNAATPSASPSEGTQRVRIAIILNGISFKKQFFYSKILPPLEKAFEVRVFETRSKTEAIFLASDAVDKQFRVILAAGGDGTVNQVLNGVLKGREENSDLPILGVIPLGTGNDFARALKLTTDVQPLITRLTRMVPTTLDVGKIEYQQDGKSGLSYFINVADAGMGPEVVSRLMDSTRPFGSAVAYYAAIINTFFSYKPMQVKIKTGTWTWENQLRTVAIGNGNFYGHGLCIAPDATPDDGLFSTFVCGDVSVLEFIRYSGTLKNSKKIKHPKVSYASATQLELTSAKPCRIEADGELLGFLPATISILPSRIRFLC
jgi:diacylglycerol kinase (ATP)